MTTRMQKLARGLYRMPTPRGMAWIERDEHSGSSAWWVTVPGRAAVLVPTYAEAVQFVEREAGR